jgi:hypothetical protein
MCRDGSGKSMLFALAVCDSESAENYEWFLNTLKEAAGHTALLRAGLENMAVVTLSEATASGALCDRCAEATRTALAEDSSASMAGTAMTLESSSCSDCAPLAPPSVLRIMSDLGGAVRSGVKRVFPFAKHDLCIWHRMVRTYVCMVVCKSRAHEGIHSGCVSLLQQLNAFIYFKTCTTEADAHAYTCKCNLLYYCALHLSCRLTCYTSSPTWGRQS